MELIRDVANELDIDVLCHKILVNVSLLTHADRGSLFLARGSDSNRYLTAKLFDVRHDTVFEEAVKLSRSEELRIPFGVGIAGTVAQTKSLVNIKNAYNVSKFSLLKTIILKIMTILSIALATRQRCNMEND